MNRRNRIQFAVTLALAVAGCVVYPTMLVHARRYAMNGAHGRAALMAGLCVFYLCWIFLGHAFRNRVPPRLRRWIDVWPKWISKTG
jgi:hypothetical protein